MKNPKYSLESVKAIVLKLTLSDSQEMATDCSGVFVEQLYESQQRDISMLQLSFETTKQLLTQQEKSFVARDWR